MGESPVLLDVVRQTALQCTYVRLDECACMVLSVAGVRGMDPIASYPACVFVFAVPSERQHHHGGFQVAGMAFDQAAAAAAGYSISFSRPESPGFVS